MMKPTLTHLAGGLLLLLLALQTPAATFLPPQESACTLRIDRIPLDTDTMSELSAKLAIIAQPSTPDLPPSTRRATAQALAIALALDPSNDSARSTLSTLTEGGEPPPPAPQHLSQAKTLTWQLHHWLSTPEAGQTGQQLANLMADSLRHLDPDHPTSLTLKDTPETGNWEGWVPTLASYQQPPPSDTPPPNEFDPFAEIKETTPEKKETPPASPQFLLNQASVKTFLYQRNPQNGAITLEPTLITMSARKNNPGEKGMSITINEGQDRSTLGNLIAKPILQTLKNSPNAKRTSGQIFLKTGETPYYFPRNAANLTGPGLVLASSALTGDAPAAIILAALGERGTLQAPADFWNILRTLPTEEPARLIVPASAQDHLLNLLTMEQKSFFLNYEVLIAATPAEMIALSTSKPSPELATALAQFAEIRTKAKGTPTGAYVANRFVLQRLTELAEKAPYHLSAKLLALQGAGKRPRALTREFLAAELLLTLTPLIPITNYNIFETSPEQLTLMDTAYEQSRSAIENLDRLTDIRDRDLLNATRELTISLRSLSRELSKNNEFGEQFIEIQKAQGKFTQKLTTLRTTLTDTSKNLTPGK